MTTTKLHPAETLVREHVADHDHPSHAVSVARIVLNHGVWSLGAEIVPTPGPSGRSFQNTFFKALELMADGWEYCEGYAYLAHYQLALPHAWLQNAEDQVLETTWNRTDAIYLGMPFDLSAVADAMTRQGSVLHDDWAGDCRLLDSHRTCCSRPA